MADQQDDAAGAEEAPTPAAQGPGLDDPSPWTVPSGPATPVTPAMPAAPAAPSPDGAPIDPQAAPADPFVDRYPMVPEHPGWGERPASTRRWAIAAAVVLAVVSAAAALVLGWRMLSGLLESDAPEGAGLATDVAALVVGDCYRFDAAEAQDQELEQVKVVACTEPHDGQVYAVAPLGFEAWPGSEAIDEKATTLCEQAEGVLLEEVYDAPGIYPSYFVPLEESWALDERTVQCVLESDSPDGLTRSYVTGF